MGWITLLVEPQASQQITTYLGETQGFWIQTGALFLSAWGAIWIVFSRSRSERRRATVEMVLHNNSNHELKEAKKIFRKLLDSGDGNFGRFLSQKESPEYSAIFTILNTHEFIACGIKEKTYDEKLYKRMQCSTMIRDWRALCAFVEEFRNQRKKTPGTSDPKTFYLEFQKLAEKWEDDPLKPHD